MILQALSELRPNCNVEVHYNNDGSYTIVRYQHEEPQPTEEEINAKIQELQAAEPMRFLRFERDRRIALTDWEVQRNIEMGIDNTDLIAYRIALRNLPQEIELGNVDAPTLDESGNLVFNSWPER